jgi:type I restriction enzyme S subunit
MKKGWQTKRLGDVCEIIKGRKPALKATATNGDLPYLVAKVMRGSKEAEYASVKDRNSITVEESETIIICDGSNSGEVFTGFRGILSSTMGKIAKKAEIDDDYLRAFLASTFDVFNGAKTGAAIPHLDKEAMYQLQFPFPPLAEQQRIVGLLDEAFEGLATAKANAEKNLQNARALFESHLQSVFTQCGPLALLSDLADEVTDGDHSPPPKAPTGVPFITISDIDKRTGTIDFSNTFTVPETYFCGLKPSKKPRVGDVLYTVTGATLGIPILVREQRDFCFQRHIGLIRPNATTDSSWLTYALRSPQVFRQATIGSTGAAQKTVSLGVLRSLQLPKVKLAEQKQIAAKLDSLHEETQRLARIYERKLAALAELKKSLLHQAFTGEL